MKIHYISLVSNYIEFMHRLSISTVGVTVLGLSRTQNQRLTARWNENIPFI